MYLETSFIIPEIQTQKHPANIQIWLDDTVESISLDRQELSNLLYRIENLQQERKQVRLKTQR